MIPFSSVRTGIDIIVSMTVGSIVEDATRLIIPKTGKAISGWVVRIGSKAFGTVVGGAVSYIFMKQVDDIVKALASAEEESPEAVQEDD